MKKFLWIIMIVTSLAVLTACMGAPAGGGGNVLLGDVVITDGGGAQASVAQGGTVQAPVQQQQPQQEDAGMFGMLGMLAPFLLMFVAMYFLIMRPQRKQAKAAKEMQENMRVGENVMTTSGFYGKIVGVGTDAFLVEFGQDRGIKVWVRKSDIAGVKSPIMTPPPREDAIEDKK